MRKNHHNPNKVPPFKPDPEHWTKKVHSWKAKVAYETEDNEFYFQAKNTVKASRIGFSHYINRDLQKLGDKNVRLFLMDNSISFDDAMALSELEAYKRCKEYYERLVKK